MAYRDQAVRRHSHAAAQRPDRRILCRGWTWHEGTVRLERWIEHHHTVPSGPGDGTEHD
jgi:hypothetical protein